MKDTDMNDFIALNEGRERSTKEKQRMLYLLMEAHHIIERVPSTDGQSVDNIRRAEDWIRDFNRSITLQ